MVPCARLCPPSKCRRSTFRLAFATAFRVGLIVLASLVGGSSAAYGDELTPELETLSLHNRANQELARLVTTLDDAERFHLRGLYLAFDPNPSDLDAMAACDDDGDYVVVLTEAMLRLVRTLATAQSMADPGGSRIDAYAALVARAQTGKARLLPPPSGFFESSIDARTYEGRVREALSFLVARELAHLRAGDLRCPHPTTTHERGDDVWTVSEQRTAERTARTIYPGDAAARDEEALSRVLSTGHGELGAYALLRFFERLENASPLRTHDDRYAPSYLTRHPRTTTRLDVLHSIVERRSTPDAGSNSP